MRSDRVTLLRLGRFGGPALVGAVALTLALEVLLVIVPFRRNALGLAVLASRHWLGIVGVAVAYGATVEIEKWASHRGRSRRMPVDH